MAWQHIALVISSTPKETRFYVNGIQTGSDNTCIEAGVQHPPGENVRVGGGNSMAIRTLIGTYVNYVINIFNYVTSH